MRDAPRWTRLQAVLLALFLPFLMALRPFQSVDGRIVDTGSMSIEWGIAELQLQQESMALALPKLLLRLGVTHQLEIGAQGVYRINVGDGQLPWDGSHSPGNFGLYGKWALIPGGPIGSAVERPSVAILGELDFLTQDAIWATSVRLAGSMRIGPVLTHLNLGFHYEDHPRVFAGAVLMVPLRFGLTPVMEASGEVRYGIYPSAASIMLGALWKVRHHPLEFDAAVRRGLSAGAAEWIFTTGMTVQFALWHRSPY